LYYYFTAKMQGNTFMVVGFYQDFKMPEISGPSNDIS